MKSKIAELFLTIVMYTPAMRQLTEDESKILFEKLVKFIGKNVTHLIDRTDDPHVFMLQKDRVFYMSDALYKKATNVGRDELNSVGTCFGKFTKSGKFKLHVTALDFLSQYAKYKVWLKPGSEMSFLYGEHVLKAHVAKMTEDTPVHQGIVIYSANDIPLGFAVSAKSAIECAALDPTAIIGFHQADVGEYLRDEATLV